MPKFSPAQRRYNKRVLVLSLAYALLLFGAVWLFRFGHAPGGPARWVLALLPALPIVGIFAAMGRYLGEENDEYLRMVEIRKALIATGLTLAVTTCIGFLQAFDLVPRIDLYWAAILWFAGLGVGGCVQRLGR
jgi:hypothetical protein